MISKYFRRADRSTEKELVDQWVPVEMTFTSDTICCHWCYYQRQYISFGWQKVDDLNLSDSSEVFDGH